MTGARLINRDVDPPVVMAMEEFIAEMERQIASGAVEAFHEKEVSHRTDPFGGIAQRFNTYEARFDRNAKEPFAIDINCIQLIETDGAWKVASLVWNNETDVLKIPAVYLRGR